MNLFSLLAQLLGLTSEVTKQPSPWTEWSGSCEINYCGLCNLQIRNRTVLQGLNSSTFEQRQCANQVCKLPCIACASDCEAKVFDGIESCIRIGYMPRVGIDGYRTFNNTTEKPTDTKTCPAELQQKCGIWTEWTGNCHPNQCGLCSFHKRTRTNQAGCKEAPAGLQTDTRECLNNVCLSPCEECTPGCKKQVFRKNSICGRAGIVANAASGYENFTNVTRNKAKTCPESIKPKAGPWSEWTGECDTNYCGLCNVQTRNRTVPPNVNETNYEYRQCHNHVCLSPCNSCAQECTAGVYGGMQACSRNGYTSRPGKDGFKNFLNITVNPNVGTNCPEAVKQKCGNWTEWTGNCKPNQCGLCNFQRRTRTNIDGCTEAPAGLQTDTRECLNNVCSSPCEECAPGCMKQVHGNSLVCGRPGGMTNAASGYENFTNVTRNKTKICPEALKSKVGPWSEWSGECDPYVCGLCTLHSRSRTVPSTLTETNYEYRQCLNLACSSPCDSCAPDCNSVVFEGNQVCSINGYTSRPGIDGFKNFLHITVHPSVATNCPETLKPKCGDWTEWTGNCDQHLCGHCSVQTKTRVNVNKCTLPLKDTRQCLNLACRQSTQPGCFTGNGCLPSCEWLELDAKYYNGRFKGQARCKLPGTTIRNGIDDYQIWMNRTDTVKMTTCHPNLKPKCGNWTEWTGNCNPNYCGLCNQQTRTKKNKSGCTEAHADIRQCNNDICLYPCLACAPGCKKKAVGKLFACGRHGAVYKGGDGYENFTNMLRESKKICPAATQGLKHLPRNSNVHFSSMKSFQEQNVMQ